MTRVILLGVIAHVLSSPCPRLWAEDRVLHPGTYKIEVKGGPHLLTPLSAAKEVLKCCDREKALSEELVKCAKSQAVAEDEARPSNPGLTLSTHLAVAAVAFAGGVWLGTR